MVNRTKLFISYSHDDIRWLRAVKEQLAVLEREGLLDVYEDTQLEAGEAWYERLHSEMSTARVGLLLISAGFLSSGFIRNEEVPRLFDRHTKDGMSIYPLLVRPCPWQQVSWLSKLQLRPQDAKRRPKAVSAYSGAAREQVLADVAGEIARMVKDGGSRQSALTEVKEAAVLTASSAEKCNTAKLPTLIPIVSESRIITGDMVVLGGNYKANTPFGFEASFCLKAFHEDLDLVAVDCYLFRERRFTVFPDGKDFMAYKDDPRSLELLPTKVERDYALNSTPGPISGALGIFGVGSSVSPMMIGDASILINQEAIALRKDWKTLSQPRRFARNETVVVRYSRVCFPGKKDEVPADFIYHATIECKLEFIWSSGSEITTGTWIMDYSEGGAISLRQF